MTVVVGSFFAAVFQQHRLTAVGSAGPHSACAKQTRGIGRVPYKQKRSGIEKLSSDPSVAGLQSVSPYSTHSAVPPPRGIVFARTWLAQVVQHASRIALAFKGQRHDSFGGLAMSAIRFLAISLPIAFLAGCARVDEGFTLPAGDAARGREAFVAFQCFECHDVHNVELPPRAASDKAIFKLGGEVTRVKTYDDLVTGIINPSHRLAEGYVPSESTEEGKSPMKVYNDVMTVAQLTDIVTFLQQHYQLRPYEPTPYPTYYP